MLNIESNTTRLETNVNASFFDQYTSISATSVEQYSQPELNILKPTENRSPMKRSSSTLPSSTLKRHKSSRSSTTSTSHFTGQHVEDTSIQVFRKFIKLNKEGVSLLYFTYLCFVIVTYHRQPMLQEYFHWNVITIG